MAKQTGNGKFRNILLILAAVFLIARPTPAMALRPGDDIPPLDQFVQGVINGNPDDLRGLYVPGNFAVDIVEQPDGMPAFVSTDPGEVTHFHMAEEYDTVGLLAHNYLAGEAFFALDKYQVIYLVFGDGRIETYITRQFLQYQALSPNSVTSSFIDLDSGGKLSASQLFGIVFNRPGDLVLQTCIYANGDASWGRLFIIAVPFEGLDPQSMPEYPHFT